MEFIRDKNLLNEMILVDGIGRSGKVMLAEIITGFEHVEKQEYNEFLEYISLAYKYNKISKDMAIAILRTQMDTELYNFLIGRGINTRPSDYTSLYKYHSPEIYFKRQTDEDGTVIAEKVLREKPIYLNWCHDMIQKSDIVFEAFNEKLKLIYINRHPIDIIYEWDKKKFGERMGNDTTELQYLIKYKKEVVPELALGWEGEYLTITPIERIIKMIYISFKRNFEALKNTKNKDSIKVINFEGLVTDSENIVKELSEYLGLGILPCMKIILLKENCPRVLDPLEQPTRRENITKSISTSYKDLLDEMIDLYEDISDYT